MKMHLIWIVLSITTLSCSTNSDGSNSRSSNENIQDKEKWVKVNDTLQYKLTFQPMVEESDVGKHTLQVYANNKMIWAINVNDKRVMSNDLNLIVLDIDKSALQFYSWTSGKVVQLVNVPIILSDANDFISSNRGVYIKLVDEDYKTENVLLIEQGSWSFKYADNVVNEYSTLDILDSNLVLINQDGEKRIISEQFK